MLISYNWLQSYFEEKLPPPEKLAERITFSFAEVEAIESPLKKGALPTPPARGGVPSPRGGVVGAAGGLLQPAKATPSNNPPGQPPLLRGIKVDTIFDIKVLPDRACYALSHRGVAYEVGAILGLKRKEFNWPQPEVQKTRKISVKIEVPDLCSRYMARVIENITPKELPWVKEHLEVVGQRMIHPVVDGANIVMFDMGQPLHAFDADKVEGGIIVRRARKGEKITTLDNKEVALDESVLIIADEKSPLAIAGIKGGRKAEVTAETRNIILESANFNASHIRKTAERLGIRTDASKRFENKLSPEMASIGLNDFSALLFEMDKNMRAGEIVDVYPKPQREKSIAITEEYIVKKLGVDLSAKQIEETFSRLSIRTEKKKGILMLIPPVFRMDLNIPEDIAEEVGRLVGYGKIPSVLPIPLNKGGAESARRGLLSPEIMGVPSPRGGGCEIPREFYSEWKIREILVNAGFSEVMTSSFSEKGDVAIEKPLAEDKKYARANLRGNFEKALKMNALNAPLFGTDEVRIFEIGQVFPKEGERTALALGYAGQKKESSPIQEALALLKETGIEISGEEKNAVFEGLIPTRSDLVEKWDIAIPSATSEKFTAFSSYPFIVRDVALFVSPLIKGVSDSSRRGVVSPLAKGVPHSDAGRVVSPLKRGALPTPPARGGVSSLRDGVVGAAGGVFPSAESVAKVIKENAGGLVVRGPELFDEFSKDGKKSLAFRLVFQSFDRTLSDEEVNIQMEKIYAALTEKGWEVR